MYTKGSEKSINHAKFYKINYALFNVRNYNSYIFARNIFTLNPS